METQAGERTLGAATIVALLLPIVMVAAAATPAAAQAVYGSIAGAVTDTSGAVLPGVTVTITSVERQTVDAVVTDEAGRFLKERLLPGSYEVKAELSGFKVAVVPRVNVSVDTQTPINFTLEVGELAEEVTVTGGAPLLKRDRADVATTFEVKQITDLPVLSRHATQFLLLTPGTQARPTNTAASENPQGSIRLQVNGQHFSGTAYQLDGTENRDPILGIIVINPTLESLAEMKVTSQNYEAEFGQATAGVVSMRTRSGGNQLHGSLFEFNRDEAFQARNPFTQAQPIAGSDDKFIPETDFDQFGGSLGGPIVRNRWFFFGDYQGTRSSIGGSRLLTVPTEAARRGDLSAYTNQIFDPATGSAGTPEGRQPFANNRIPESRLSPQALAILDLVPLPNAPGVENGTRDNFLASGTEDFDEDSVNIRIDGRVSDSTNLFGRYSIGDFLRDGATAFGAAGGEELVSLGGISQATNQSLALGVDRTLSPTLLADVRFGWFRYSVDVLPFDYGTTPAADAGIPGLNLDTALTSGMPAMFVTGGPGMELGSALGVNRCNCPLDQEEDQWQIVGNVIKIWGDHTIKLGADVRRAHNLRLPSDRHRSGELTFNGQRTAGPGGVGGLGLASFLLGEVTRFTRYFNEEVNARERQWRQFYYVQDTWRPSPKWTFNYGIRLDVIHPQTVNAAGNGGWLDLDTGDVRVGGVGGIGLDGDVENTLNWAPRVGATYQWDDRTVIRAGYGRSYDIGVFGSLFGHSVTQNLPVLSIQEINRPSEWDDVFNLRDGPPPASFQEVGPDGTFRLPDQVFARALPKKQRLPAVDAWNVMVQRQLTSSLSFDIGYVGNRGARVFAGSGPTENINQPTIDGFVEGVPTDERRPFFSGLTTPVENLGGAFGWTQGIDFFCTCAHNWYNALQAKLEQRFSQGFTYRVSYTLQRATGEGDSYFFWDRDLDKGPNDFDRTQNLIVSTVAELPIGRNRRFGTDMSPLADAIVGGWQVNMNYTYLSGRPFNVSYRGAGADRDVGPNRPDLIGDPDGPKTRDEWFNATPIGSPGSAFGRPDAGTFGTLGRNALRGPSLWQVDASLFKNVRLGGNRQLQIRIEATNLFNHVNLGQPDATVGVPGDDNPNAGRINSTAGPQRFFQLGLRFAF